MPRPSDREEAGRPQITVALMLLAVVVAGATFLYHVVFRYQKVRRVRAAVERRLHAARERNERLKTAVKLLQSDQATLEYEIRRQLGYVAPGERVILVRDSSTTTSVER